ncbi:DUF3892 domain-containing protein [Herbaspirillum rubrisubalbicans Os34]|uniref:DUF3892 domain-containing protein n=1 Tax=Herbaspirillum rubrisubalbicans Os34 TaxID=1235827 RepID=A0A6M3ZXP2_9BURK|nr:DUF3892 domain-containing protein [Herbaspirillum rubrisubalbicans]QJQ03439.1 DUF3892 domain-containing protein [Herbaspirillum rubrisubalbicans Os34]
MATTIKCVARRMAGGNGHEHISQLWWEQVDDARRVLSSGNSTREQMVAYIEKNGDNSVWCPDRNPALKGAWVRVQNNGRIKYVQTVADGRTTDNLLSLPLR